MEFGVHLIIGLKVICTIEDNMLKLTLLNLAFIFALCERLTKLCQQTFGAELC